MSVGGVIKFVTFYLNLSLKSQKYKLVECHDEIKLYKVADCSLSVLLQQNMRRLNHQASFGADC